MTEERFMSILYEENSIFTTNQHLHRTRNTSHVASIYNNSDFSSTCALLLLRYAPRARRACATASTCAAPIFMVSESNCLSPLPFSVLLLDRAAEVQERITPQLASAAA